MLYSHPVDKKGPRFRKPAYPVINQEFHRKVKKELPGLIVSTQEIKEIINVFHEVCIETIANTRDGLELPFGLGYIIVAAVRTNREHFIQEATNYQNWETNQYMCKIFYTNRPSKYKFKFNKIWGFKAGRQLKKAVSQSFSQNHTKFYIMSPLLSISQVFKKTRNPLEVKTNRIQKRIAEGRINPFINVPKQI